MAINSKKKGARGELEFSKLLQRHGIEARRGQQFSGSPDSPDVVHSLDGVHVEVKRTESLSVYTAMEQAIRDCGSKGIPVVAHRRNGKPWLVICLADDLIPILKEKFMEDYGDI